MDPVNPVSDERLPTAEEIANDSLDGRYAIKHFLGKTLAEAEELFAEGCAHGIPLTYTEDLYFMEPVGFRFYIRAAVNPTSATGSGNSHFSGHFQVPLQSKCRLKGTKNGCSGDQGSSQR
jgi:hypothetical protein